MNTADLKMENIKSSCENKGYAVDREIESRRVEGKYQEQPGIGSNKRSTEV